METSQQSIETRPAPPGGAMGRIRRHRRTARLISDWRTTSGKLRVTRLVLVLAILLSGSAAVLAANARVGTTLDIAVQLEPLSANATTLYRSLADADATVALAFLSGGVEPEGPRKQYEQDRDLASDGLRQAAAQTGQDPETVNLIADLSKELPVYTGYVERVRANNRQGTTAAGRAYLGLASELMKDQILPQAAELQRRQAARLDDAYRRAGSVPAVAIAACVVSLAGLIWAQIFLFQRTHRVVNLGLAAATVAVLIGLLWWTAAVVASANALGAAHRHNQAVSDALGPAQIAIRRARAIETNQLVSSSATVTEGDFNTQIQLFMGFVGAAQRFDPDQGDQVRMETAVNDYASAHTEVQKLNKAGADTKAAESTSATTFTELDKVLTDAVDRERTAFGNTRPKGWWLTGLPIATGLLALAAAVGVALGIRQRLEEYR